MHGCSSSAVGELCEAKDLLDQVKEAFVTVMIDVEKNSAISLKKLFIWSSCCVCCSKLVSEIILAGKHEL